MRKKKLRLDREVVSTNSGAVNVDGATSITLTPTTVVISAVSQMISASPPPPPLPASCATECPFTCTVAAASCADGDLLV